MFTIDGITVFKYDVLQVKVNGEWRDLSTLMDTDQMETAYRIVKHGLGEFRIIRLHRTMEVVA